MIFFGDDRVPFQRPLQAGQFTPRSPVVRMYSDVSAWPQFMPPMMARFPKDIRMPLEAEPGRSAAVTPAAAAAPVAPALKPVAGIGYFGAADSPLALARKALFALPAFARRAVTAGKIRGRMSSAMKLVNRGRNPAI